MDSEPPGTRYGRGHLGDSSVSVSRDTDRLSFDPLLFSHIGPVPISGIKPFFSNHLLDYVRNCIRGQK